VTHCDTMWHFDMFVTLKVFKLIWPSNDGRRHGRGTYWFMLEYDDPEPVCVRCVSNHWCRFWLLIFNAFSLLWLHKGQTEIDFAKGLTKGALTRWYIPWYRPWYSKSPSVSTRNPADFLGESWNVKEQTFITKSNLRFAASQRANKCVLNLHTIMSISWPPCSKEGTSENRNRPFKKPLVGRFLAIGKTYRFRSGLLHVVNNWCRVMVK
jgi:hypothetical protein